MSWTISWIERSNHIHTYIYIYIHTNYAAMMIFSVAEVNLHLAFSMMLQGIRQSWRIPICWAFKYMWLMCSKIYLGYIGDAFGILMF